MLRKRERSFSNYQLFYQITLRMSWGRNHLDAIVSLSKNNLKNSRPLNKGVFINKERGTRPGGVRFCETATRFRSFANRIAATIQIGHGFDCTNTPVHCLN